MKRFRRFGDDLLAGNAPQVHPSNFVIVVSLIGATGFEPATFWPPAYCATKSNPNLDSVKWLVSKALWWRVDCCVGWCKSLIFVFELIILHPRCTQDSKRSFRLDLVLIQNSADIPLCSSRSVGMLKNLSVHLRFWHPNCRLNKLTIRVRDGF